MGLAERIEKRRKRSAAKAARRSFPWFTPPLSEVGSVSTRDLRDLLLLVEDRKPQSHAEKFLVRTARRVLRTHLIARARNAASVGGWRPTLGARRS